MGWQWGGCTTHGQSRSNICNIGVGMLLYAPECPCVCLCTVVVVVVALVVVMVMVVA